MQHEFQPDPAIPGICAECDLPKANRRHEPEQAATDAAKLTVTDSISLGFGASVASLQAAIKAAPHAGTVKAQVLAHIAGADPERGATDAELAEAFPTANVNTLRPRRIELVHEGWLEAVLNENGREVLRAGFTAWRLTPSGRVAWARVAA